MLELRHHFLRDDINKEVITLDYINSENQIADILTKPFNESTFTKLRRELGICSITEI